MLEVLCYCASFDRDGDGTHRYVPAMRRRQQVKGCAQEEAAGSRVAAGKVQKGLLVEDAPCN